MSGQKYIKLSTYAKENCMCYRTAWTHWNEGLLKGKQLPTGAILVLSEQEQILAQDPSVATYARVSSSENKDNLKRQSDRLREYSNARGYKVVQEVQEIGSGLNDNRKKLQDLLSDESIKIIVVEHKDRIARFGINYINLLLEKQGRRIEVVNQVDNDKEDLMQDFVSIITSFCARLYGQRRTRRKTEQLIQSFSKEQ